MKLISAIRKLISRKPLVMINIFGFMGEGKTNTAKYVAREFEDEFDIYYAQAPTPEEATSYIYSISGTRLLIILDDLSFIYHGHSEKLRIFENTLSRVRHITGAEKVILILIYHYFKSVVPFMRMAQIHILTSVSRNEFNTLKELFWYRYLKEFFKLYDAFIWEPEKFKKKGIDPDTTKPALMRALTRHSIVWIPLVTDYEFEENNKHIRKLKVPDVISLDEFIIKCVRAGLGYKQSIRLAREFEFKFRDEEFHKKWVYYSKSGTGNFKEEVILCAKA